MQEIKKIKVLSLAKVTLLFGILFGLIAGIMFTLLNKYVPIELAGQVPSVASLGAISIVIMPIIYGIVYFLAGLIGASIYNLFASWVGGIKVELVAKK